MEKLIIDCWSEADPLMIKYELIPMIPKPYKYQCSLCGMRYKLALNMYYHLGQIHHQITDIHYLNGGRKTNSMNLYSRDWDAFKKYAVFL